MNESFYTTNVKRQTTNVKRRQILRVFLCRFYSLVRPLNTYRTIKEEQIIRTYVVGKNINIRGLLGGSPEYENDNEYVCDIQSVTGTGPSHKYNGEQEDCNAEASTNPQ